MGKALSHTIHSDPRRLNVLKINKHTKEFLMCLGSALVTEELTSTNYSRLVHALPFSS